MTLYNFPSSIYLANNSILFWSENPHFFLQTYTISALSLPSITLDDFCNLSHNTSLAKYTPLFNFYKSNFDPVVCFYFALFFHYEDIYRLCVFTLHFSFIMKIYIYDQFLRILRSHHQFMFSFQVFHQNH